ncbi:MAG: CFI-box-CTERM domain-containing protein, partial [Kofleriaceae bacterium]|nr:CFI-box-CTERM domain-containing protein [Kofleriaceae bacterium]
AWARPRRRVARGRSRGARARCGAAPSPAGRPARCRGGPGAQRRARPRCRARLRAGRASHDSWAFRALTWRNWRRGTGGRHPAPPHSLRSHGDAEARAHVHGEGERRRDGVYGSALDGRVGALRRFRDRHLRSNAVGRMVVSAYETIGPVLADWIARSEERRAAARFVLEPMAESF